MPLRGLGLLVFIVASVPVCFFRPFYGVLLWTVVAFLYPQSYTWAFDAFPWATAVAVPTILGMLVFERHLGRLASREIGLLVLLWIWFTVTTVVSTSHPTFMHHAADTWARWTFVSKILLMTVCMVPIVNSFERLRYLMLTIGACFAFYVLKAVPFIIATGGEYRLYGPARSMLADNNDFGLALNMTLPLYFYLAQTETKSWMRRSLWFLFIATIPVIFFTHSRGALVGLVAVFFVLLLRSRRRFALVPVAGLALVIALAFAPEAWRERMNPTRSEAVDASAQSRLHAWAYARALTADYPITGGGFQTYTAELYERYWPTDIGRIWGAHSVYFQVLAEHGYVGLGLYLCLVVSCLATTRRLRKAARSRSDTDVAHYAEMFQLSLVGFLLCGIFLGRAYFDYFFTIVACIMILDRAARDRWLATTEPAPHLGNQPRSIAVPSRRELSLPAPRVPAAGGQ